MSNLMAYGRLSRSPDKAFKWNSQRSMQPPMLLLFTVHKSILMPDPIYLSYFPYRRVMAVRRERAS